MSISMWLKSTHAYDGVLQQQSLWYMFCISEVEESYRDNVFEADPEQVFSLVRSPNNKKDLGQFFIISPNIHYAILVWKKTPIYLDIYLRVIS